MSDWVILKASGWTCTKLTEHIIPTNNTNIEPLSVLMNLYQFLMHIFPLLIDAIKIKIKIKIKYNFAIFVTNPFLV